ncbi:TRAP transporter small permease [Nesterenkonia muleiensis]|uniref:TRAP transporter small permease n=1 Tax=Nesterenkonia muleiensis TaxID=2282648 RepID=UPI0013007387|nr:TRAP transporter small permease [Nesterenkonia muleiensis]
MTLLIIWSVAQRYILASPIAWNISLIETHLMLAFLCFSLANTARAQEHVTIDSLYRLFSRRYKVLANTVADAVTAIVIILFIWANFADLRSSWVTQSAPPRGSSQLLLPNWTSDVLIVVGFAIFLVTVACRQLEPDARRLMADS